MRFTETTRALAMLMALAAVACGDGPAEPGVESMTLELAFDGLRPLDAAEEGVYEAWIVADDGMIHSAGRFDLPEDGRITLAAPAIAEPTHVMITVEPPGDGDDRPSQQKLLGGPLEGGTAALGIEDYVTAGIRFEEDPGVHVLTTVRAMLGDGSDAPQDAGLWLFDPAGDTVSGGHYLTVTPLTRGWMYEGWIVRDHGTDDALWISYGKFEPDGFKKASVRDETGLGPFSGWVDYARALPDAVDIPGDDWLSNPLDLPVPGGLELPFDLNGCVLSAAVCADLGQEYGPSRWTHVITIEPATDEDEPVLDERPFLLRPYRNPIGEAPPEEPRAIDFHPDGLPTGTAVIAGAAA